MTCAICHTRRPRRFCPGVKGDICAICCGTEREVTVDCPLDCEYLRQGRAHEKLELLGGPELPEKDVPVTEAFLEKNEQLVQATGGMLAGAAMQTAGVIDFDLREALDSLIRSYRTLQSGLIYESLPSNPVAASIHRRVQEGLAAFRNAETAHHGMAKTRDADVLGVLVFFRRVEFGHNNGRKRGRAFLDLLRSAHWPERGDVAPPPATSLILP